MDENPGHLKPPATATAEEESRFWVECGERRWAQAVRREAAEGFTVCDTDPLKLHFAWSLARARIAPAPDLFESQLVLTRAAIARRTLGIADLIACVIPSEAVLRERREGDTTRQRRNFDTHVRLARPLFEWYGTLNDIDPGRVIREWPDDSAPSARSDRDRYDLDLFDTWMEQLPAV
ncbi:hypothetical protein [Streptomyces sp. 150FB]|uniref:hypothetical protein n=1 Tax=Streptomyces sp. 150FB TaxID=1576605 RepID=UPI0006966911|nr:hypothetical protein [Streptomyces sp. 150FB]